jgi:hypothetical protein
MICDSAQMIEFSRAGEVQVKLNVERCRRIIEESRRFLVAHSARYAVLKRGHEAAFGKGRKT